MENPTLLPPNWDGIGPRLRQEAAYVLWKGVIETTANGETRINKIPLTKDGAPAKTNDPSTHSTFGEAQRAFLSGVGDGIGIITREDLHALDLDKCRDPVTGNLTPAAQEWVDAVPGCWQISPTGTGLRWFGLTETSHVFQNTKGFEVFRGTSSRYATITGHVLNGCNDISDVKVNIDSLIQKYLKVTPGGAAPLSLATATLGRLVPTLPNYDLARFENEVLPLVDLECDYDTWLRVYMAAHHQFNADIAAFDACENYFAKSSKYRNRNYALNKWNSFSPAGSSGAPPTTLRSLLKSLGVYSPPVPSPTGPVVLSTSTPYDSAQLYRQIHHRDIDGPTFWRTDKSWYIYRAGHYSEASDEEVRRLLYEFMLRAINAQGNLFNPTPKRVNDVIDGLRAAALVPDKRAPFFIDPIYGSVDPVSLIILHNGIYDTTTNTLLPHTSALFNLHKLPFDYDPKATCPKFMAFIDDILDSDVPTIELLQEMFGYYLCADTSMQKIGMLIGPRRSGKGTLGRVLQGLLGKENIASPTMASLTTNFGLQPLVGKLLAIISDARAPGRDHQTIVERLLMISGEDSVSVDRKYKGQWEGTLTARILIMSNEDLTLGDSSGALTGRLLPIVLKKSYYGREDRGLTNKLLTELPGIFLWALEGRRRLYQRNHFVLPSASEEAVAEMENMNSPIKEFLDTCVEDSPLGEVSKDTLYKAYRMWAIGEGLRPTNKAYFCKQLRAAKSGLTLTRPRTKGGRVQLFAGLALTSEWATKVNEGFLPVRNDLT